MTDEDTVPARRENAGPHHTRRQRALHAVRSHVRPGSFVLLLAATALNYVLNGLALETDTAILLQAGRAAVVFAGIYVLSGSRSTLWLGLLMVAFSILTASSPWIADSRPGRVVQDALAAAFLVWVLAVVLREVFRPSTSERNAVMGALCGFVLIIGTFMRLHGLVEASWPGAYHVDGPALSERSETALVATFQYFSTITLTTVGFGDIVPVSPVARLLTGLEAIVGQVYLAVVVATLVSRVAARRG